MCYRFELLEFEDGLFENIDATYILHLEGNGRLQHIYDQLKTYHPTNKVYLVYNKGTTCKDIPSTNEDLIHANMTIFEHASSYKHILVLEDDFIFSPHVVTDAKHVDEFLKWDSAYVYQLGSKPFFAIPMDMHHYRTIGLLAHANIYSHSARKHLLESERKEAHIDNYIKNVLPVYMYHRPLCYQTFPMTKNRKNWHKHDFFGILKALEDGFISWTNLENEPELGFAIMYWIAKCMPIVVVLLVIWILSYIPCPCTGLKGKRVR